MIEASTLGLAAAFTAGIVSFLSPCVLPLVPGYVSYIAGQPGREAQFRAQAPARAFALGLSLFFVLGFSSVFMVLGASATALSQLLLRYRFEANIAGGLIIILFGLYATGLIKLRWFQHELRYHPDLRGGKPLAAYLLGLAFGFGWTPCVGPILGAILTLSALSPSVSDGIALLGAYSLGLGIPFLASAAFLEPLIARYKAMKRAGHAVYVASGAIMIATGAAMITGQLSAFSYWLLETFPTLGAIG